MLSSVKSQTNVSHAKSPTYVVVGAVLILFSLACALWRLSASGPGFVGSESYSTIARQVLDTGSFQTAFRPPLYPLYLASMMAIFGEHWELAAVLGQALLSAALGCLVFSTAARLAKSERAGLIAAILYLSNALYQFEATAKRETTLFTLFFAIFFWSALFVERARYKYLLLALSAGLCLLLRPNAIALLPVGLIVFALDYRRARASFSVLVAPAIVFVALVVPWQLFVKHVTGTFPLTTSANSGQVLWKGNNDFLLGVWPHADIDAIEDEMTRRIGGVNITTSEGDALLKAQAVEYIKADPTRALKLGAIKAALFFAPFPIPLGSGEVVYKESSAELRSYHFRNPLILFGSTLHTLVIIVATLGFLRSAWSSTEERRLGAIAVITITIVLMAIHTLSYPESRYRWPLDILWTILAGAWLCRFFPTSQSSHYNEK